MPSRCVSMSRRHPCDNHLLAAPRTACYFASSLYPFRFMLCVCVCVLGQLRNVGAMEVNSIRGTFMKVLSAFSVMGRAQEDVDRTTASALAERTAGMYGHAAVMRCWIGSTSSNSVLYSCFVA